MTHNTGQSRSDWHKILGPAVLYSTLAGTAGLLLSCASQPVENRATQETVVRIQKATESGPGRVLGEIRVYPSEHGLVFHPDLQELSPGLHGFHLHENPSCDVKVDGESLVPAGAAGSHYDPDGHQRHGHPWNSGHLGDIPALYVNEDGTATSPVLAPRLRMDDLKGRSLVIHAGGDNYSDDPAPLGGGGPRVACGVIR